jgi:hypothetical protein
MDTSILECIRRSRLGILSPQTCNHNPLFRQTVRAGLPDLKVGHGKTPLTIGEMTRRASRTQVKNQDWNGPVVDGENLGPSKNRVLNTTILIRETSKLSFGHCTNMVAGRCVFLFWESGTWCLPVSAGEECIEHGIDGEPEVRLQTRGGVGRDIDFAST